MTAKASRKQKDMAAHNDEEFRAMVRWLMNVGWYRVSREPASVGKQWGFRQGHTLDAPAQEHWVVADSEIEAVRIMWNVVRTRRVGKQPACH